MAAVGKMGLWAVVALGVGGMVGGGIFAVLGLAVQLAHGGTPVAFALAGMVALLTAYSYAKLSVAYPSRGGTVTFLDRTFGAGMFTGSLNVLLWLSYVVMLSLYAFAFGSYGATFLPQAWQGIGKHALISLGVIAIAGMNLLNAELIGKAEIWIVGLKAGDPAVVRRRRSFRHQRLPNRASLMVAAAAVGRRRDDHLPGLRRFRVDCQHGATMCATWRRRCRARTTRRSGL